jgi:hypothetical protein
MKIGSHFDQANAGRFERLEKTARQAHGDAVFNPLHFAVTDIKLQRRRNPLRPESSMAIARGRPAYC